MKQFLFSFFLILGIDQFSKLLAPSTQLNTGISFGLFSGPLLTVILVIVLLYIAITLGKSIYTKSPILCGFFFGGAFSNILDRILFGGVRDFLPVPILNVRNNIADWAVVLSLVWFVLVNGYNTAHDSRKS